MSGIGTSDGIFTNSLLPVLLMVSTLISVDLI
jgi:hypothetical protein